MGAQRIWGRLSRKSRLRRAAARAVLAREEQAGADGLVMPGTAPATAAAQAGAQTKAAATELEAMQSLVSSLAALPPEAWDHAAPAVDSQTPARSRQRITPRQSLGLVAAAACLVVAFLVGSLTHPTLTGPSRLTAQTPHVALEPLPGTDRDARAVAYMTGGGGMRLHVRRLAPSAPGTYYELWLMSSNSDLISVTSFRVGRDGLAELTLRLPADPTRYRFLDISVQRVGSGTAISGDDVLRGAIG